WALGVGAAAGFAAAIVAIGMLSRSGGEAERRSQEARRSEVNLPQQR
ncbi:MFS transporter, partial [Bradyrhizobium sp. Cham227]|nr:MFS transporter [Bradyrhizobium brasilense]